MNPLSGKAHADERLIQDLRAKLSKCIEFYRSQVRCIHGSTVNCGLVDTIRVPYQGQDVPLSQIAFSAPKGRVIVVRPCDPTLVDATRKAIVAAGLQAYTTRQEVIVTVPSPNSETRERNQRRVRQLAEEGKVAVRQVRQDCRARLKELTEDERKKAEKAVQQAVDAAVAEIDADSRSRLARL